MTSKAEKAENKKNKFDRDLKILLDAMTPNGGEMMELKACPFCGVIPELLSLATPVRYFYHCTNCGIGVELQGFDRDEALLSWNHRPIEDALQQRIDELEAENKRYQSIFDIQKMAIETLEKDDRFDIGWDCAIPFAAATLDLIFLDCRKSKKGNITLSLSKQKEIVDNIRNIYQPEDK